MAAGGVEFVQETEIDLNDLDGGGDDFEAISRSAHSSQTVEPGEGGGGTDGEPAGDDLEPVLEPPPEGGVDDRPELAREDSFQLDSGEELTSHSEATAGERSAAPADGGEPSKPKGGAAPAAPAPDGGDGSPAEPTLEERYAQLEQDNRVLRAQLAGGVRPADPGAGGGAGAGAATRRAAPKKDDDPEPAAPGDEPKYEDFDGSVDDFSAAHKEWADRRVAHAEWKGRQAATERDGAAAAERDQQARYDARSEELRSLIPDWDTRQQELSAVKSSWAAPNARYASPTMAFMINEGKAGAKVAKLLLDNEEFRKRAPELPYEPVVWQALSEMDDGDKLLEHFATVEGAREFDRIAGVTRQQPMLAYSELGALRARLQAASESAGGGRPAPVRRQSAAPRQPAKPRGKATAPGRGRQPARPDGTKSLDDMDISDMSEYFHQQSVKQRLREMGMDPAQQQQA